MMLPKETLYLIELNLGLRALAKSKLTNFCGKYGQKENQLQTKLIDNIASLCELLTNESINIHDFQVINEQVPPVQYKFLQILIYLCGHDKLSCTT